MKVDIKILFSLITLFFLSSFSLQNKNLVEWKENQKLSWSDYFFMNLNNSERKALAMTATNIEYTVYEQKGKAPRFVFRNYFNKEYSWTRTTRKDILKHEQLHFDISELYTRKMRKELGLMTQRNIKDVKLYLKKFEELNQDMIINQKRYDKETHFKIGDGENLSQTQQYWYDSINNELNKLEAYRSN